MGAEDPGLTLQGKEEVVRSVTCDHVSLMERVSGRLEITTFNIFFFSDASERREGQSCECVCVCCVVLCLLNLPFERRRTELFVSLS